MNNRNLNRSFRVTLYRITKTIADNSPAPTNLAKPGWAEAGWPEPWILVLCEGEFAGYAIRLLRDHLGPYGCCLIQ